MMQFPVTDSAFECVNLFSIVFFKIYMLSTNSFIYSNELQKTPRTKSNATKEKEAKAREKKSVEQ